MKLSDGLFRECAQRVAEQYPDIEYQEIIVDNLAMPLVFKMKSLPKKQKVRGHRNILGAKKNL